MNKEIYNKAYKKIRKILGNEFCMKYEEIENDLKQIMENYYINEKEYKGAEELAKIYSLRWGALFNASTIYEVKEIIKKGEILMFDSQEELIKEIKKKNGMFTLENLWDYEGVIYAL